jgi:hypothetical protein
MAVAFFVAVRGDSPAALISSSQQLSIESIEPLEAASQ